MKYLIVLVVILIVFWLWRSGRNALDASRREAGRGAAARKNAPAQLEMVRCPVCGVHLPEAEAVRADATYYCSIEHLNQARGG